MIRYSGFTKRFGGLVAVHELDLGIEPGETVAVIGPNGSGKTTTLKAALGLVRPSAGVVRVAGHDATRAGRLARARLGYLPQRLTFPEGSTAREAIRLFARIRGADPGEIGRLLERVGLADAADRTAETFSGGMRQRLGLAIALLGAPSALILDEPTAALDPSGALTVRDLVETIREEGTTVLLSSHDLAEVSALADRIAIFVGGRVAAVGSREEMVGELGLVARLRVECPALSAGPEGEVGGAGPPRLAAVLARAGGRRIRWEDGAVRCDLKPGMEKAVLEAVRQAELQAIGIAVERPGLEEIYRAVTMPATESAGRVLPFEPRRMARRAEGPERRRARERGIVVGGGER
jgi:Cu-processing system ATP-binding protein